MILNPTARVAFARTLRQRYSLSMPERILAQLTDDDLISQYENQVERSRVAQRTSIRTKFVRQDYLPQK